MRGLKKAELLRCFSGHITMAAAILILLSALAVSAALPQVLKIGVAILFHPRVMEVALSGDARGVRLVVNGIKINTMVLEPRTKITIHVSRDVMSLSGIRDRRSLPPDVHSLGFAPGGVEGGEFTFKLIVPGKLEREYRGGLKLKLDKESRIVPIITRDVESVVEEITAVEMKGETEIELLKAQAVAVRSYLLAKQGRHNNDGYDFCDTTHCQLFQGASAVESLPGGLKAAVKRAVAETRGEALWAGGAPVAGYYSPACPDYSSSPEITWGRPEPGIVQARNPHVKRGTKYFPWEREASRNAVLGALEKKLNRKLSRNATVEITKASRNGGFVEKVRIVDGAFKLEMRGDEFRRVVGVALGWNTIPSNSFTITERGTKLVFRGEGFGHGVGLCQNGAREMARRGEGYRAILKHYFPKADIRRQ